ncbi:MAC/perforin domain-containing protein [Bacteroides ihuae]|uniref:MAC/perforin domain-containing protein n=1 Tax=Bacteroides ihuae TaxID=1852362 RepID=UPI0008DAC346|nr:MAC/perforin domain-containing protein [Bacteroides ihuae]
MKKNSLVFMLFLALGLGSCDNDLVSVGDNSDEQESKATTRSAGDAIYDVLGYGYDVTGEYLHPLSVRNPVLDIEKYKKDLGNRIVTGTASFGYDKMYSGYSSLDYLKEITNETKVDANMSIEAKSGAKFSGTISSNSYFKSTYSYSSKYSFASLDAIRNIKYIRINDEISRISQYLSDEFIEDLNRLSADRLVERYGTHVLTDITIGGRYKVMFRSVITNTTDSSIKKRTVKAGFTAALKKIGFGANLEHATQTEETLIKNNQNKELYVLFYGGNGTNMKYDLEKGMPTTVDIKGWEDAIKLQNANLTNIKWEETYPIYDFITDPAKKAEVKAAVERHIEASQINVLDLIPLYTYYHDEGGDHDGTTDPSVVENYVGWKLLCIEGYILKNKIKGTVPLYEYYNAGAGDHYTTIISDIDRFYPPYVKQPIAITGYVYKDSNFGTVPLYEYYNADGEDHYTSTIPDIPEKFVGWKRLTPNIGGYIYPKD